MIPDNSNTLGSRVSENVGRQNVLESESQFLEISVSSTSRRAEPAMQVCPIKPTASQI